MRYSFHGGLPPKEKIPADALRVARHMLGEKGEPSEDTISLPDKPLRDFSAEEIIAATKEARIRTPLAPEGLDAVLERATAAEVPVRIVVNCTSCEDGVFLNRYLCREKSQEIAGGTKILMQALRAREAVLVVDDGDLSAIRSLEKVTDGKVLSLHVCERKAPAANEKILIYLAYRKETPVRARPEESGFAVFDAEACCALFRAFAHGERMTQKLLCLSHADGRREIVSARFGLSVSFTANNNSSHLIGGALSGSLLSEYENGKIAIDGTYDAVRVLKSGEEKRLAPLPCINCGRCEESCPMYLDPARIIRRNKPTPDSNFCIGCGVCSAVCPSRIDCASAVLALRKKDEKDKEEETENV